MISDPKWIEVPIESLSIAPWNYKEDDSVTQETLTNNIKKNGQLENIIVRTIGKDKYEVVNGNHRVGSFKDLGFKKVIVCNVGKISQEEAELIAIETNETKFKANNIRLAESFGRITKQFEMAALKTTVPFNEEKISDLLKLLNFDWTHYDKKPTPEVKTDKEQKLTEMKFYLPTPIANAFELQILRFKKALEPDTNPNQVSYVPAVTAMLELVSEIADDDLVTAR